MCNILTGQQSITVVPQYHDMSQSQVFPPALGPLEPLPVVSHGARTGYQHDATLSPAAVSLDQTMPLPPMGRALSTPRRQPPTC